MFYYDTDSVLDGDDGRAGEPRWMEWEEQVDML